jgi:gliding motility-associated-like protein
MKKELIIFLGLLLLTCRSTAQTSYPMIDPLGTYTDDNGDEQSSTSISGNAPLTVHFAANPSEDSGWSGYYEWRFYKDSRENEPYMVRYDEETEVTFSEAGTHLVVCYATFVQGNDTVAYTDEYWNESGPITVTISESRLEMPNGFSPNGDGINDVYKAKKGWQSIVEFHAYIFNRWGQKLYEWTDPDGGWDGTFHGKDVKDGVYFCLVKARGADGRKYNIKTDVNLLRGYTESSGASASE